MGGRPTLGKSKRNTVVNNGLDSNANRPAGEAVSPPPDSSRARHSRRRLLSARFRSSPRIGFQGAILAMRRPTGVDPARGSPTMPPKRAVSRARDLPSRPFPRGTRDWTAGEKEPPPIAAGCRKTPPPGAAACEWPSLSELSQQPGTTSTSRVGPVLLISPQGHFTPPVFGPPIPAPPFSQRAGILTMRSRWSPPMSLHTVTSTVPTPWPVAFTKSRGFCTGFPPIARM